MQYKFSILALLLLTLGCQEVPQITTPQTTPQPTATETSATTVTTGSTTVSVTDVTPPTATSGSDTSQQDTSKSYTQAKLTSLVAECQTISRKTCVPASHILVAALVRGVSPAVAIKAVSAKDLASGPKDCLHPWMESLVKDSKLRQRAFVIFNQERAWKYCIQLQCNCDVDNKD